MKKKMIIPNNSVIIKYKRISILNGSEKRVAYGKSEVEFSGITWEGGGTCLNFDNLV